MLRLCPIAPFITLNIFFSLTNVAYKIFALGQLGMLPGLILRVFIGTTFSSLTTDTSALKKNPWVIAAIVVGLIVAVLAIVVITKETRKYLKDDYNVDEVKIENELEMPTLPV
jgi:uncharacterized membrane protein YdjX (TVP38/TMEM64 family)